MTELDTTPTDDPTAEPDSETPDPASEVEAVAAADTVPEAFVQPEAVPLPEPEPESAETAVEPGALPEPEPESAEEPSMAIDEPAIDEPATTSPEPTASEPRPGSELRPVVAAGPRTVGRFIADALRTAGVRYAFTVPGESFLGLLDALEDAGIHVIATRHEGAAAFMAEAHGQLTGRPAIALGTRAVGGTNMAIGIHTARQDSTPMFVAVGQVERRLQGREAFQEIDQVASLGRLAKWSAEPRTGTDVADTMAEATRQALTGRPGPVLLSLPEDLLDEPMPEAARLDSTRPTAARPSDRDLRDVIELLAAAERPVILAGGGVLHARTSTELVRFAELLQVPVIAAWRRADVISNDHPLFLGMAGFGAPSTVPERLGAADALLVIGSRLNEPTTFAYTMPREGLRWAHVDLVPGTATGSTAPEFAIAADAKLFLKAANERLLGRAVLDATLVATRRANNLADRAAWEAASVVDGLPWDGPGVHPGRTIATLRRVLPDDAILTTDAGNFAGWAGRGFRFRRPGTFLGPTSGAMGYGLPAAIAAAVVHRDRPVVALVGDGGMAMTMAELETAVRVGARVVVVVFDNQRYGTIRMWQERRGTGIGVASELGPVDFAAISRACGARGVRVERDSDFEAALRTALAADRATVIQLAVDPSWVSVDVPPA